jgi:nucleoside-diphosphate-sugar epimerase
MKKKVLLTGATGLLGSHILKIGLSKGYEFYVLSRNIGTKTYLHEVQNHPQIQIIHGDLLNLDTATLPLDVGTVIHAAALASSKVEDKELLWQLNVESTKKLFNFYSAHKVHWVQISSVATMCDGSADLVDESFQGQARDTYYAKSKLAADAWLESQNSSILYIHPCYLLGEWDSHPSSGIVLFALRFKKIKHFKNNTKNFVSAFDVASGVWQAIEAKALGHYLLGHHNVPIQTFLEKACLEMGIPQEAVAVTASMDDEFANEFCAASAISSDKAKKDFGYNPQMTLEKALTETMNYFAKNKMLRRNKDVS